MLCVKYELCGLKLMRFKSKHIESSGLILTMSRNLNSCLVPVLLALGFIALVVNIFQARTVNMMTEQLEKANMDKQTLHSEMDEIAAELVALKGVDQTEEPEAKPAE